MAAVALAAGGGVGAVRLGLSMTLLQLGIGTVNDLVDAAHDAGRKPGKPIPAGLVPPGAARGLAVACFAAGLALGVAASPAVALLGLLVIAIGLAYDLRLKGTAWSWLPFAVGIPILPIYGWLGAAGGLPPAFLVLVPAAVLAGAALSIANSLVDVERDGAAGRTSVAARLGRARAGAVQVALLIGVLLLVLGSVAAMPRPPWTAALALGGVVAAIAAAVLARRRPDLGERAWQAGAVSLGIAAFGWVAGVSA